MLRRQFAPMIAGECAESTDFNSAIPAAWLDDGYTSGQAVDNLSEKLTDYWLQTNHECPPLP